MVVHAQPVNTQEDLEMEASLGYIARLFQRNKQANQQAKWVAYALNPCTEETDLWTLN